MIVENEHPLRGREYEPSGVRYILSRVRVMPVYLIFMTGCLQRHKEHA